MFFLRIAALPLEEARSFDGLSFDVVAVGKKAEEALRRRGCSVIASFPNNRQQPSMADVLPLAHLVIDAYTQQRYHRVVAVWTDYQSPLVQRTESRLVLPITREELKEIIQESGGFEPVLLRELVKKRHDCLVGYARTIAQRGDVEKRDVELIFLEERQAFPYDCLRELFEQSGFDRQAYRISAPTTPMNEGQQSAHTLFLTLYRRFDERVEKRVRGERAGLEFGMELGAEHKRMHVFGKFRDLHQSAVRRAARKYEACSFELLDVIRIHFVSMPVPL